MKYNIKHIGSLAALAVLLTATGCTADDAPRADVPANSINFSIADAGQWTATRGSLSADARSSQLQAPGMERPLFLTTTVADGFHAERAAASVSSVRQALGDSPQWNNQTRGTKVTQVSQITSFGVSAFLQKTTDVSLGTPGYFYNLPATKNEVTGLFTVSQDYFWPADDEHLFFYAYYPYGDSNVQISSADAAGPQTIDFTAVSNVADQVDLMTAVALDEATPQAATQPAVQLNFRHELCAVSFKIQGLFPASGGIVSVGLSGIYGAGTMTINQDAPGTWNFTGRETTTFKRTLDQTGTGNQADNGKLIGDELTFLMIPQELTDDAVIELVYQDQRQNYTLTASLKEALKITDDEAPNYGKAFFEAGKTVTFALSSTELTTLKISGLGWPSQYNVSLPKDGYAYGDKMGLYALADDGKTFAYKNVPVTYNGSKWEIDHTTAYGTVYNLPGYHYYVYFPYTPTPNTDYPLDRETAVSSTADVDIFSSLINGWGNKLLTAPSAGDTDYRDQSQQSVFINADLQIAELHETDFVSQFSATMKHAMGLAVINIKQSTLPKKKTYKLSTDQSYTFLVQTGTQAVTASSTFSGSSIPYGYSASTYYYWVKPSTATTVGTDGADSWGKTLNVALDATESYDAESARQYVDDGTDTYTMAVGDVYFTDGSLGKSGSAYPQDSKTPAGIVFALRDDMSSTHQSSYGHGYVFSLKDANAYQAGHQWTTLASNDVSGIGNLTWDASVGMTGTNGTQAIIKNLNIAGQDGLANTTAVGTSDSDYPAFQAVGTYNSTTCPITATQTNSGWFLPSIAEWHLVCVNLGKLDNSKLSNASGTSWGDSDKRLWGIYYNGEANHVHADINTALAKAGAKGTVYNPIQGGSAADSAADMSAASHVVYWSSSEWSGAGYAFSVGFYSYGNLDFYRYGAKSNGFRVRPVLAF